MGRIAVGIEYDGTGYHGWQQQSDARSIQQDVQQALGCIADSPVSLVCAGRTDAGVHARAQVAHFDTSAERSARAWVLGPTASCRPRSACAGPAKCQGLSTRASLRCGALTAT
jgi:tRNA pseudouridine38-40 synthase